MESGPGPAVWCVLDAIGLVPEPGRGKWTPSWDPAVPPRPQLCPTAPPRTGPPPPPSYPSPTQGSPLLAGPPGLFPAPANRQPKLVLSACAPCTTAGDTHLWLRVLPLDTREQAGEGRGLGPPDTSLSLALGGPRRRGPGWVRERAPPWASPGMLGKGGDSTATSGGCSQAGSKDRGFLRFL